MNLTFDIAKRKFITFLLMIVSFLLVAGLISVYLKFVKGIEYGLGFVPLFNLDGEYNIPAFYSTLALLICAALLWYIHLHEDKKGSKQAIRWKTLSFVFIYLGLDELSGIHENFSRLAPLIWQYVPELQISRKWVMPFLPILIFFAFYFMQFYLNLPGKIKIKFAVATAIYIGGVIGVEVFGAWYSNTHDLHPIYRGLFSVVEEGLEMTGIVYFIGALLSYIHDNVSKPSIKIQVAFTPDPQSSKALPGSVTLDTLPTSDYVERSESAYTNAASVNSKVKSLINRLKY
jgi:hypothetical protein